MVQASTQTLIKIIKGRITTNDAEMTIITASMMTTSKNSIEITITDKEIDRKTTIIKTIMRAIISASINQEKHMMIKKTQKIESMNERTIKSNRMMTKENKISSIRTAANNLLKTKALIISM